MTNSFRELTPDVVLDLVEQGIGKRSANFCRPLSSYINRVYDVELESREWIVAKFYRPGRWERVAIEEEHAFMRELDERDVPVVAPLMLPDGSTLGEHDGMFYALFPKRAGRAYEEPDEEGWLALGRLVGRIHSVGAMRPPRGRVTMDPSLSTVTHLESIRRSGLVPERLLRDYENAARSLIAEIAPMWKGIDMIRLHGDLHFGNLLYRPGESLVVIDFDDMALGPPVQDIWMLLPNHEDECYVEIELFLEGYRLFRPFDRSMLALIEPLRGMRYVHFTAWCCAQQVDGGGLARVVPMWGTDEYWTGAIRDLRDQLGEIKSRNERR